MPFIFLECSYSELKSLGVDAYVYVTFWLDIWWYVTQGRSKPLGNESYFLIKYDFSRFSSLPSHWYYKFNQHGKETAVALPLKVRALLARSDVKKFSFGDDGALQNARIMYIEKMRILCKKGM